MTTGSGWMASRYIFMLSAMVAIVWLFPTVHVQMFLYIACPRWCIVTLLAFVWLFPTVYFWVAPKMAYLWGWRVILVALVWLFSFVCLAHWNVHIRVGLAFARIMFSIILIHHSLITNVVSKIFCFRLTFNQDNKFSLNWKEIWKWNLFVCHHWYQIAEIGFFPNPTILALWWSWRQKVVGVFSIESVR